MPSSSSLLWTLPRPQRGPPQPGFTDEELQYLETTLQIVSRLSSSSAVTHGCGHKLSTSPHTRSSLTRVHTKPIFLIYISSIFVSIRLNLYPLIPFASPKTTRLGRSRQLRKRLASWSSPHNPDTLSECSLLSRIPSSGLLPTRTLWPCSSSSWRARSWLAMV